MNPVNERNAVEVAKTVRDGAVVGPSTVRRSLSVTQLAAALVKVQQSIEDPTKNKKAEAGTRGSYRYADLPTVLDAVRPVLTANGFAVSQLPCECDGEPSLTTLVVHTSGEWLETTIKLRPTAQRPAVRGQRVDLRPAVRAPGAVRDCGRRRRRRGAGQPPGTAEAGTGEAGGE